MDNKPWETEDFTDFLNDVNRLATDKYGWNVGGYNFVNNEMMEVVFIPAGGMDSLNRKF